MYFMVFSFIDYKPKLIIEEHFITSMVNEDLGSVMNVAHVWVDMPQVNFFLEA